MAHGGRPVRVASSGPSCTRARPSAALALALGQVATSCGPGERAPRGVASVEPTPHGAAPQPPLGTTEALAAPPTAASVLAALAVPAVSASAIALEVAAREEPLPDLPAALVARLSVRPYVEASCREVDATLLGLSWPHRAASCEGEKGALVTANPPPARVAAWIVDAMRGVPALERVRARDPVRWQALSLVVAEYVLRQSSRVFPLRGPLVENGATYVFDRGVSVPCKTCFCRVSSVLRADLCRYRARMGEEAEATCLERLGTRGPTEAWLDECLENHRASWGRNHNPHLRARLMALGDALEPPPRQGRGARLTRHERHRVGVEAQADDDALEARVRELLFLPARPEEAPPRLPSPSPSPSPSAEPGPDRRALGPAP